MTFVIRSEGRTVLMLGFAVFPEDASAAESATAIRRVNSGRRYLDPEMAASAMTAGESPLTERERDVWLWPHEVHRLGGSRPLCT